MLSKLLSSTIFFYLNKFLNLKISAIFHQKDDKNEIKINGFIMIIILGK